MIFQTVGKKENPAVLFFHAMGVTSESSRPVAEYLKDRYYCILPHNKLKATAPKGAAARYTESRTESGGGYFLCLGGENYEKTEEIQTDKVHGEDLALR